MSGNFATAEAPARPAAAAAVARQPTAVRVKGVSQVF